MLALIQMLCCLGLVLLSQRLSKAVAIGVSHVRGWRDDDRLAQPPERRVADRRRPAAAAPAAAGGHRRRINHAGRAGAASALAGIEHLSTHRHRRRAIERDPDDDAVMEQPGAARSPAAVGRAGNGAERHADPCDAGIVLATGFFLLLNTIGLPESADGIVIFTNALMAIPMR